MYITCRHFPHMFQTYMLTCGTQSCSGTLALLHEIWKPVYLVTRIIWKASGLKRLCMAHPADPQEAEVVRPSTLGYTSNWTGRKVTWVLRHVPHVRVLGLPSFSDPMGHLFPSTPSTVLDPCCLLHKHFPRFRSWAWVSGQLEKENLPFLSLIPKHSPFLWPHSLYS